jgi:putative spermidine/putrescine transport system substrate-binding protein
MKEAGTADEEALAALPEVDASVEFPDDEQQTAAQKVVSDRWNSEMTG